MGHCIQAIVTRADIADRVQAAHPQLPRVVARQGFVILPIDDEFIDSVTVAQPSRPSDDTFMLLTDSFQEVLREFSRFGRLAYIETDSFGGTGGQGAAVYSDDEIIMEPEWGKLGPINRALKLIGVHRGLIGDCFSALGLGAYRSNDDLIDAALK